MKFVYVLEDDPKFQKEIVDAIQFVDPKIQVRLFPKLESFAEWMKFMMTTGPAAISQGGLVPASDKPAEPVPEEAHQLVLVVSKVEYLGVEQLGLLRKTRDLFVQRGICTKEDPTAFVLTAFDNPNFPIRELEDRILNNVIFKPFDRLILIQDLTFAIDGRHPPSKSTITNQKTTAVVEMLKDVEMEAISDVGLISKSYREIPVGAVSKYYGKIFLSDRHRSLFAICQRCEPHPQEPKAFRCFFTFFAADQTQISNIRKKTREKGAKEYSLDLKNSKNVQVKKDIHVLLLDEEENSPSGLSGQLGKRFEGIAMSPYDSFAAFLSDLDPSQALQQRDANLKAFGGANSVTLTFDQSGTTYLGFESDKKDLTGFFGVPEATLKTKSNWFSAAISHEHKEKYRKYVQTQKLGDDNILPVTVNEVPFLVKAMDLKKEGTKFLITLTEPGKDEQVQWLQKNSRLQKPVDVIIASHRLFGEGAEERWKYVKEALQKKFNTIPVIFMTTKKDFTDAEERNLGGLIQDIFFKPVDRVYFFQKIKTFFPFLIDKGEKTAIHAIEQEEIIKAVNPIKVTEISEAGFVMQYYRSISVGSFREMVLWQPYEIGAPELLATCNFVEENQGQKGVFSCHFVFFGITDHFLKHIRVWIRDNYVLSKEQGGG